MTTDTDKLVEMLRASGAEQCNSAGTLFMVSPKDAAAFRDRIIASLCGDVEPVAEIRNKFGDPESFAERELVALADIQKLPIGTKLYSAATVAALKSERDALAARIDALMLEHCPDEMTEAQKAEWAAHQKPAENAELAARVAELEKDAGRYRLLRRGQKWSVVDGIGTILRAEVLDAAIDSAALAAKGQA